MGLFVRTLRYRRLSVEVSESENENGGWDSERRLWLSLSSVRQTKTTKYIMGADMFLPLAGIQSHRKASQAVYLQKKKCYFNQLLWFMDDEWLLGMH